MSPAPSQDTRTALVFGASGITGWAVLRETLRYPTGTAFRHIIGLFNRPVNRAQLYLQDDERLTLASGIDLRASVDQVAESLSKIDGIGDVTDVYFAGRSPPLQGKKTPLDTVSEQHTFSLRGPRTLRDMKFSRKSMSVFSQLPLRRLRKSVRSSSSGLSRRVERYGFLETRRGAEH